MKRKLAKRVEELTTAGKQVVGGVADSVASLKRRIRRLRRSQDRMKSEQSAIERNFASQQKLSRNDLGESSRTLQLKQELQQMQTSIMQQNSLPQQQNFMTRQIPSKSNAELENVVLKQKLQIAELKNQLLQESYNTVSQKQPALQEYSGSSMHHFFNNRKARKLRKQQEKAVLAEQIQEEQDRLNHLKAELGETPHSEEKQSSKVQMQADIFLQLPDDQITPDLPNEGLYQAHKSAAYADVANIQNLALKNSLELLHTHI